MELRHLRYFLAVADGLSFRGAAERLNLAQSALSVQIRQLEAEIGAELFIRNGRSITLTQAGRLFREHAQAAVSHARKGADLARRAAIGEIGNLTIGYNAPAEFQILPKVIPAFTAKWPGVHFSFHSLRVSQQIEGILRDEVDVGITWLPVPDIELDVHPLYRESLIAILPAEHPLARSKSLSIKDFSNTPLILFPKALYVDVFHEIEQLFLRSGATMNLAYELETPQSVVNFVAAGIGCSILPDYVRSIHNDAVVYRKLRGPNMVRSIAIIKKKGRADLAQAFYRFTQAYFSEDELMTTHASET